MSRTITIIGILAILAFGAIWVWKEPRAFPFGQVDVTNGVQGSVAPTVSAAVPSEVPRTPIERHSGWPANLFAFAQDLKIKSAAGDSRATWLLTRVYDYCAGFGRDPQSFNSDTDLIAAQIPASKARLYRASRNRMAESCKGFSAADFPSTQQLSQMRAAAAAQGNLAAQAEQLRLTNKDPAYAAQLAQKVVQANDPDALLALSQSLPASEAAVRAAFPTAASPMEANYAMQLMACRAGLDCTADGWLMTALCANGGMCSGYSDLRGMIDNDLLTPSAARRVDDLVSATTRS